MIRDFQKKCSCECTKELVEQVARALATKSVRDTDFDETESVNGEDWIAIVQNGVNRKVRASVFYAAASAILRAVTFNALTGRGMSGGITISCNTIDGLSVVGCNIASSDVTITASTIDYVSVVGNNLRGTYSIANCSHRLVENNI